MTTSSTTTTTPPKRNYTKMVFMAIGFVLALLGTDHYTTQWISGGAEITVTDKNIVISPIDTIIKKDTNITPMQKAISK